ncbi:hypothetical protein V2J09_004948 [Rumex salicifolius]
MAREELKVDSMLVRLSIEAACASSESVERWRMQRRTLERLPSPIAEALFHRLLHQRLIYPSLLEIFKSSLENIDLSGEQSVDAEWIAYIGAFSYLHSLNLADCHRVTTSSLWPITGLTSLKEIDLSRCTKFTDAGINHLLSIPQLEKLHISGTGVTVDGIKLLSSLENLKSLDLGGLPVSDSILTSLQGLIKLEYLDLWGSFISNKGISILGKFPKLNHLSLAWTSITMFPNLKHLKYLDMSNCTINSILEENGAKSSLAKLILHGSSLKIATEVFSSLESSSLKFLDVSRTPLNHFDFLHPMSALEHLDLSYSMLLDESLEDITKVGGNLRHLNLNNTKISSTGVATLVGQVPKLESISLSHTLIDDFAIVYISMMTQLQAVDLSDTSIRGFFHQIENDEDAVLSLAELKNLNQLKKLDLSKTLITDSELSPLSSLQVLDNLSLRSANLTDNCLTQLESIRNLVDLSIRDALLTDNALSSFNPPPKLRSLDLRGCWLLTDNAVKQYYQKHHHHHIQVDHELFHFPSIVGPSLNLHGSSSKIASHNSATKKKGPKDSGSPSPFKKDLIDQRVKYSMEQLLSLEHANSAHFNISSIIPEPLIGSLLCTNISEDIHHT